MSLRVSPDILNNALKEVITYSTETKPRKFVESVELQLALKGYTTKDERFNVPVVLPHVAKPNTKVIFIADAADIDRCKKAGVTYVDTDYLKNFNKDAKQIKRFAKSCDVILASKSIVRNIPRLVGPGLSRANRTPVSVNPDDDIAAKVHEMKSTLKVQFKKAVGLNWGVGNIKMTPEELSANVNTTLNFLATKLKKGWQNIKVVYIKSTMGKPHKIF